MTEHQRSGLDRDAAREVLKRKCPAVNTAHQEEVLGALEKCVRPALPQAIDPDAVLRQVLLAGASFAEAVEAADRICALLRPVAPPQTIDRDALVTLLLEALRGTHVSAVPLADDVLALLRPVEGVVLTPEEAAWCHDLVSAEREQAAGHPDYNDSGAAHLLERLKAAS